MVCCYLYARNNERLLQLQCHSYAVTPSLITEGEAQLLNSLFTFLFALIIFTEEIFKSSTIVYVHRMSDDIGDGRISLIEFVADYHDGSNSRLLSSMSSASRANVERNSQEAMRTG